MKKSAPKVAYFNLFAELFSSVNRHKSPILFHKNGTLRKKLSSKEVYFSLIAEIFSTASWLQTSLNIKLCLTKLYVMKMAHRGTYI